MWFFRLQDVLNGLRIKCAKQEKQYKDENQQLTEDYKRITEQFRDLQRKSRLGRNIGNLNWLYNVRLICAVAMNCSKSVLFCLFRHFIVTIKLGQQRQLRNNFPYFLLEYMFVMGRSDSNGYIECIKTIRKNGNLLLSKFFILVLWFCRLGVWVRAHCNLFFIGLTCIE